MTDCNPMADATCVYPDKKLFPTRDTARGGAREIKQKVQAGGGTYTTLYPYKCPGRTHWHLTHHRQGTKACSYCGEKRPAWYDSRRREWVVYAHGGCGTNAISTHKGTW